MKEKQTKSIREFKKWVCKTIIEKHPGNGPEFTSGFFTGAVEILTLIVDSEMGKEKLFSIFSKKIGGMKHE